MGVHELVVKVRRPEKGRPWGIRLAGGSDIGTPLVVTQVQTGSCVQGQLQPGDQITKIDSYDARDLRHEDAQTLFRDAQDTVKLAIRRDAAHAGGPQHQHQHHQPTQNAGPYSPRPLSAGAAPLPAQSLSNGSSSRCSSSQLGAFSPAPATQSSYSPVYTPYRPVSPARPHSSNLAFSPGHPSCPLLPPDYRSHELRRYRDAEEEMECVVNQPYRTTPLVLPGAKVKRDTNANDCYLRHHPNPAMRAAPHSTLDHHEIIMKQKVADSVLHRVAGEDMANKVVHKQFNSPIGLYSDANIADTIRHTTGNLSYNGTLNQAAKTKSFKPTVVYDPAKSETFRALQEDVYGGEAQEVAVPAQTKLFQPNRVVAGKKPLPVQQPISPITHYANSLGDSGEIQQSGSFKRLMHHVLSQGDF